MNYAVAIMSGLLLGIAVAAAKHYFIWQPYATGRVNKPYGRMIISLSANVLTLLAVFLLRGWWPYSFNLTIIAVALGLTAGSAILAHINNKKTADSADK